MEGPINIADLFPIPSPPPPNSHLEIELDLNLDGVVIIPTDFDCAKLRADFDTTLSQLPCFKPDASKHVLGGFGALGSPGSFHNEFARGLRLDCLEKVTPVLKGVDPIMNLEMMSGRMLYRAPGTSPSRESWHRDQSPNATIGDHVFGGWINLGSETQYFSCILGTHRPGLNWPASSSRPNGFSKITSTIAKIENFSQRKSRVEIPVGSILLFYENIIHEVYPAKAKKPLYRLHLAWRLTHKTTSLIPNMDDLLDSQAPIPMKSGQKPPMWAAAHWNFYGPKVKEFSFNFEDTVLEDKTHPKVDGAFRSVPRFMRGLRELGRPMYEPYGPHERALYHPYRH